MTYSRNEEKANITLEKCNNSNLFDYMMGGKKDISVMEINAMKREQMMMNKFGNFVTDSEASKKNSYWSKLFDKSNIHLSVLSFNKDYVDENIGIDNLQKELTTKILPMFLKQCGYQDPYKLWTGLFPCIRLLIEITITFILVLLKRKGNTLR